MATDRTVVTELATGLGMLGRDDTEALISERPPVFANLTTDDWDRLEALWLGGEFTAEFEAGLGNGRAFLESPEALAGRVPRIIEWIGGRNAPGDEVVPADLRVDHVYLISCKYLSKILHNLSPSRLMEGLLSREASIDSTNWYERVAPVERQALYQSCVQAKGWLERMPALVTDLDRGMRNEVRHSLKGEWPIETRPLYLDLCSVVSERSAKIWQDNVVSGSMERLTWRLLRIGSAPYFILGSKKGSSSKASSSNGSPNEEASMRLRVATPWDLRQRYETKGLQIDAQEGGQPRVGWQVVYRDRRSGEELRVCGHVEIRWSHGRFGNPPEAKVYLDTPPEDVPGYIPLADPASTRIAQQPTLWT